MAKSKSTSDSKASRSKKSKEQNNIGTPAGTSDVQADLKTVAQAAAPAEVAAEVQVDGLPRKMEVVKSEPRKNVVVPIKLENEIRRRAYELYLQRGTTSGSEAEDWLTAEREVRERYQQQRA